MTETDVFENLLTRKARRYSSIKYCLATLQTVFFLFLLFLFLGLGFSKMLAADISQLRLSEFFTISFYIFIIFIGYYILSFPIVFYQSFMLEHQFGLSRQTVKDWFADQLKGGFISYILTVMLLGVFYFIVGNNPDNWWWIVSLVWLLLNIIIAGLVPIVLIPLFFKYKKLSDQNLRQRIIVLAAKMKIALLDVFEIDLSKKTVKANAGLTGWGRTRRVILADTLKINYTFDEIEVILAHEFSHYKLKHLMKLIFLNSAGTILGLYLIFRSGFWVLSLFGLSSWLDISAAPLIFIYLIVFSLILKPVDNYFSRKFEKDADILALKCTGLKEAFISAMDKLGRQNLSDRAPHPMIKFLFFDHPPIDERINTARSL